MIELNNLYKRLHPIFPELYSTPGEDGHARTFLQYNSSYRYISYDALSTLYIERVESVQCAEHSCSQEFLMFLNFMGFLASGAIVISHKN